MLTAVLIYWSIGVLSVIYDVLTRLHGAATGLYSMSVIQFAFWMALTSFIGIIGWPIVFVGRALKKLQ